MENLEDKIMQVLESSESHLNEDDAFAYAVLDQDYSEVIAEMSELIRDHNIEKEAVRQYKISLFNEIDYYVNNMIDISYEDENEGSGDKVVKLDDLQQMIQEMQQREF